MRSSDSLHYSTQGLIINQLNQGYHFIFCIYLFDFLMNVSSSIKTWYWSMLCYKGYFSHKNAFASILKQGSGFFFGFFFSFYTPTCSCFKAVVWKKRDRFLNGALACHTVIQHVSADNKWSSSGGKYQSIAIRYNIEVVIRISIECFVMIVLWYILEGNIKLWAPHIHDIEQNSLYNIISAILILFGLFELLADPLEGELPF